MSLHHYKNGRATCKRVVYDHPAETIYRCTAGPYTYTFSTTTHGADAEAMAKGWCDRHKGIAKRAPYTSTREVSRPDHSAPDPAAPLYRKPPRPVQSAADFPDQTARNRRSLFKAEK